jgi:hypothetical protein
VRIAPVVLAGLVLVGCGTTTSRRASNPQETVHGDSHVLVLRPAGPLGRWVKLLLSPDGTTYLGQWSGECEVQEAFFIPVRGGMPRPVTGRRGDESLALGWAMHNRARILVPRALCGTQFRAPGVYLVDPRGRRPVVLVRRVRARPGGA